MLFRSSVFNIDLKELLGVDAGNSVFSFIFILHSDAFSVLFYLLMFLINTSPACNELPNLFSLYSCAPRPFSSHGGEHLCPF